MSMVKEGYICLVFLTLSALLCSYFALPALISAVLLLLAAFCGFFFRNPDRSIPQDPDAVVSPADGRVIKLEPRPDGTFLSIFLSIFDVHVNRAPIHGRIVRQQYQKGKFKLAWDENSSLENEQLVYEIGDERTLKFALVAGLVARRIVPWTRIGQIVGKGDRIGLIRFGSRVDLYFPSECRVIVAKGDRVKGGSTILAYWSRKIES